MKHKLPVFIINMQKDVDRKEHMQVLCKKFNLNVEFIRAVDGELLSDTKIKEVS